MSLSPERPQSPSSALTPRPASAALQPTANGSHQPPYPASELAEPAINGAIKNGAHGPAGGTAPGLAGPVPAPHARPVADGVRPAAGGDGSSEVHPACRESASLPASHGLPSGPWVLNELFPSCTETARRLLDQIMQRLQADAWDDSDRFAVHLALEEGLINAIKHGNKYDRNKHVHVRCTTTSGRFEIEIEDEGPGFDPEDVPDCTEEENLEACSGRGIALMRCFMSHVEYQNHGRRLVMAKSPTEP